MVDGGHFNELFLFVFLCKNRLMLGQTWLRVAPWVRKASVLGNGEKMRNL